MILFSYKSTSSSDIYIVVTMFRKKIMRDLQTNLVLGPADDLVAGAAEEKERLGYSESNILDMLRVGDSQDSGHDSPHRL